MSHANVELNSLVEILPANTALRSTVEKLLQDGINVAEIVMDLGRNPQVRSHTESGMYDSITITTPVTEDMLYSTVAKLGTFGETNRVGIPGTLHRVSALRGGDGLIVGLTIRVGRTVEGATHLISDLLEDDALSILLIGPPGRGKTSKLRDMARTAALYGKRVIVVDGTNEIAGEHVVPHSSIGDARRMMVGQKRNQARAMVEAIENHTPEILVIDEISNSQEIDAARTCAERGVKLYATAHGSDIQSVIDNPALCWLLGGIQSSTLGDDEARRRGGSKASVERRYSPSFDVLVELLDFDTVAVYLQVAEAVDALLRGDTVYPEIRVSNGNGWRVMQQYAIQGAMTAESCPQIPLRNPSGSTHNRGDADNNAPPTKRSRPSGQNKFRPRR